MTDTGKVNRSNEVGIYFSEEVGFYSICRTYFLLPLAIWKIDCI